MRRLGRGLLIVCGTLCVGLGALALVLPLVPAMPFLLLAGFCYARSSARFHRWLHENRWFGTYLRDYRRGRRMRRRDKIVTLLALWLAICISAVFVASTLWIQIPLFVIAIGVTLYLVRLKEATPARGALPVSEACAPDRSMVR